MEERKKRMPETILPRGLFDQSVEEDRALLPEKQSPYDHKVREFMLAIVSSAVRSCFTGSVCSQEKSRKELEQWAVGASLRYHEPLALENVCDVLNISHTRVQDILLKIARSEELPADTKEALERLLELRNKSIRGLQKVVEPTVSRAGEQREKRRRLRAKQENTVKQ